MIIKPIWRAISRPIWGKGSAVQKSWALEDLFSEGQGGLVYLASQPNLYTDVEGINNVTQEGGDLVASIDDLYGPVDYRGSQATTAKRPMYDANGNFLIFDGQDDSVDTGTNGVGSSNLLCKPTEQFFIAVSFETASNSGTLLARGGASFSIRPLHIYFTSNAEETPAIRIMGSGLNGTNWGLNDGLPHVLWLNWDGVNLRGGYDGVVDVPLDVGIRSDEELDQTITLGARTDGGTASFLGGKIGSLVIRDQSATQDEITRTVSFLRDFHL